MKKLIVVILVSVGFIFSNNANAQLSININIGNQPAWGPAGYSNARYYYLPEVNSYYDVSAARFMYLQGNRWIYSSSVPQHFGRINLYNTYKVVLNRNYDPYRDNRSDLTRYAQYRNVRNQIAIRDSRSNQVYNNKNVVRNSRVTKAINKNNRQIHSRNVRTNGRVASARR